ncbi:MAG: hypothetical protein K0U47_05065 [Epsilonproteobacteria bacterium]|nr:hypothetical protein [Campylobacterota bacterium]
MEIFIYSFLGLIIIYYELNRKKYFKIDHITFFNFFFFLVYAFTPIALLIVGSHLIMVDMPYGEEYFGKNFYTPLIVLISYLFFMGGFSLVNTSQSEYQIDVQSSFNEDKIYSLLPFAYLLLFLFVAIYIYEFGGLMKAIELAQAYRSGALAYHKFDFVQKFFPLNTLLLYYTFYKYFLEKKRKSRELILFYFLLSLSFVFLITVINNSRGFLIFQLSGLYVITAIYHKNYFLKYLLPTLITVFIVIKYGRPMFQSINFLFTDGWDAFIAAYIERIELKAEEGKSIISNFTHPIVSLETSLVHSGYDVGLRYFRDIIDAFLLIIPNELFGIKEPEMLLMEQNTLLLQGRDITVVLPGILGFFSYAGQVVGVFVGAFVYGVVGALLFNVFRTFYEKHNATVVFSYLFSLAYGYFVFRGVPAQVLNDSFIYLVVMAILLSSSKFQIYKVSK